MNIDDKRTSEEKRYGIIPDIRLDGEITDMRRKRENFTTGKLLLSRVGIADKRQAVSFWLFDDLVKQCIVEDIWICNMMTMYGDLRLTLDRSMHTGYDCFSLLFVVKKMNKKFDLTEREHEDNVKIVNKTESENEELQTEEVQPKQNKKQVRKQKGKLRRNKV